MMEVKKTILFTLFKAPHRHVNNTPDKQENFSKREETLIFYQHQKSSLCGASTFYGDLFENGEFWLNLHVPRLQCLLYI